MILGFDTDFTDPVFGWNYFHGDFYLAYKEVLNVFGTALIAGLLVMMVRRAVVSPRKLDYARPDRAPGEPQFDRHVYRLGDWVFVVIAARDRAYRVPARGGADRDGPPRLRRHAVRRLAGRAGA